MTMASSSRWPAAICFAVLALAVLPRSANAQDNETTWRNRLVERGFSASRAASLANLLAHQPIVATAAEIPDFIMGIDSINPPTPYESTAVTVPFTITPVIAADTTATVVGTVVNAAGVARRAMLTGAPAKTQVHVTPGQDFHGTLRFSAPAAGDYTLKLVFQKTTIIMNVPAVGGAGPSGTVESKTYAECEAAFASRKWRPILDTDHHNAQDMGSGDWAPGIAGNSLWLHGESPRYEWTPVLAPADETDDTVTGLSGWVAQSHDSGADVPFTHPFGFDYNSEVVLDDQFTNLHADNFDKDKERQELVNDHPQLALTRDSRMLHIEMDQAFIPSAFRPAIPNDQITATNHDRVAAFGRWIVDCGHDNYQAEIHPPLMYAAAHVGPRPGGGDGTFSTVISRPWLVSQEFGDGALFGHLLEEVKKVAGVPTSAGDIAAAIFSGGLSLMVPHSAQVEARSHLLPPFSDFHVLSYYVRAPTPPGPHDKLVAQFFFSTRPGVKVNLLRWDAETIRVNVYFFPTEYTTPPAPVAHEWLITLDGLNQLEPDIAVDQVKGLGNVIRAVLAGGTGAAALLGDPLHGISVSSILGKGFMATKFDIPSPPQLDPTRLTSVRAENLTKVDHFVEDSAQPWPVYGWINVHWATIDFHEAAVTLAHPDMATMLATRVNDPAFVVKRVIPPAGVNLRPGAWEISATVIEPQSLPAGTENLSKSVAFGQRLLPGDLRDLAAALPKVAAFGSSFPMTDRSTPDANHAEWSFRLPDGRIFRAKAAFSFNGASFESRTEVSEFGANAGSQVVVYKTIGRLVGP